MTAPGRQKLSLAQYVAQEAISETRHEHVDGETYAMASGTDEHAALAARLIVALGRALEGTLCEPRTSDLRVRTSSGLSTYPDVAVVCGRSARSPDDPGAITNPTLLVEVLSESSEAYDRGAKLAHHRSIPGLAESCSSTSATPGLTSHARNPDGTWITSFAQAGETLLLRSFDVRLEVDVLSRGMTIDPAYGRLILVG